MDMSSFQPEPPKRGRREDRIKLLLFAMRDKLCTLARIQPCCELMLAPDNTSGTTGQTLGLKNEFCLLLFKQGNFNDSDSHPLAMLCSSNIVFRAGFTLRSILSQIERFLEQRTRGQDTNTCRTSTAKLESKKVSRCVSIHSIWLRRLTRPGEHRMMSFVACNECRNCIKVANSALPPHGLRRQMAFEAQSHATTVTFDFNSINSRRRKKIEVRVLELHLKWHRYAFVANLNRTLHHIHAESNLPGMVLQSTKIHLRKDSCDTAPFKIIKPDISSFVQTWETQLQVPANRIEPCKENRLAPPLDFDYQARIALITTRSETGFLSIERKDSCYKDIRHRERFSRKRFESSCLYSFGYYTSLHHNEVPKQSHVYVDIALSKDTWAAIQSHPKVFVQCMMPRLAQSIVDDKYVESATQRRTAADSTPEIVDVVSVRTLKAGEYTSLLASRPSLTSMVAAVDALGVVTMQVQYLLHELFFAETCTESDESRTSENVRALKCSKIEAFDISELEALIKVPFYDELEQAERATSRFGGNCIIPGRPGMHSTWFPGNNVLRLEPTSSCSPVFTCTSSALFWVCYDLVEFADSTSKNRFVPASATSHLSSRLMQHDTLVNVVATWVYHQLLYDNVAATQKHHNMNRSGPVQYHYKICRAGRVKSSCDRSGFIGTSATWLTSGGHQDLVPGLAGTHNSKNHPWLFINTEEYPAGSTAEQAQIHRHAVFDAIAELVAGHIFNRRISAALKLTNWFKRSGATDKPRLPVSEVLVCVARDIKETTPFKGNIGSYEHKICLQFTSRLTTGCVLANMFACFASKF